VNGVTKSGYVVNVLPDTSTVQIAGASKTCNSTVSFSAYFAEAHPVTVGSTGQRSFGTDARGTIYYLNTGVALTAGMSGASVLQ